MLGLAALGVSFAIIDVRGASPMEPSPLDVVFGIVAVLFLVPVVLEFRTHVDRDTRREIAADVALITAASGFDVAVRMRETRPRTATRAGRASPPAGAIRPGRGPR